ncbi:hypothetical protein CIX30_28670 [Salmonella enterica]|uniref:Uncharacterized protein n=1 Tax=Salmonella enterica I TaxID=59201 RepID=A0A403QQE5_SALET|nr:hypothetical protein [Salmonella enterica subsp. enterica serovar Blockley]ECS7528386.1 hypothetical protein [Salmonella enterica]ECU7995351.1 hypothetical protein [Salmonella enterica subsp. enterica serovar Toucra]MML57010.1 hypothetical protein [Salmonella enterica subsp. enterica serovar Kidderminster]
MYFIWHPHVFYNKGKSYDTIKIFNEIIFKISRKEDLSINIKNSKKNILLAAQLQKKNTLCSNRS